MTQQDDHRVILRRARQAGIKTAVGVHCLRAPRRLPEKRRYAGWPGHGRHSSPRTTKLYDLAGEEAALGEYEKVRI